MPGISPACPCWLTASGTNGDYYCLRQGHCLPATRIAGLKTEGRKMVGQDAEGVTVKLIKLLKVFLRLMNAASEHLKIRNPCYHITSLALSLLFFHLYFLKCLHSAKVA